MKSISQKFRETRCCKSKIFSLCGYVWCAAAPESSKPWNSENQSVGVGGGGRHKNNGFTFFFRGLTEMRQSIEHTKREISDGYIGFFVKSNFTKISWNQFHKNFLKLDLTKKLFQKTRPEPEKNQWRCVNQSSIPRDDVISCIWRSIILWKFWFC